jgi:hypothetical protein
MIPSEKIGYISVICKRKRRKNLFGSYKIWEQANIFKEEHLIGFVENMLFDRFSQSFLEA